MGKQKSHDALRGKQKPDLLDGFDRNFLYQHKKDIEQVVAHIIDHKNDIGAFLREHIFDQYVTAKKDKEASAQAIEALCSRARVVIEALKKFEGDIAPVVALTTYIGVLSEVESQFRLQQHPSLEDTSEPWKYPPLRPIARIIKEPKRVVAELFTLNSYQYSPEQAAHTLDALFYNSNIQRSEYAPERIEHPTQPATYSIKYILVATMVPLIVDTFKSHFFDNQRDPFETLEYDADMTLFTKERAAQFTLLFPVQTSSDPEQNPFTSSVIHQAEAQKTTYTEEPIQELFIALFDATHPRHKDAQRIFNKMAPRNGETIIMAGMDVLLRLLRSADTVSSTIPLDFESPIIQKYLVEFQHAVQHMFGEAGVIELQRIIDFFRQNQLLHLLQRTQKKEKLQPQDQERLTRLYSQLLEQTGDFYSSIALLHTLPNKIILPDACYSKNKYGPPQREVVTAEQWAHHSPESLPPLSELHEGNRRYFEDTVQSFRDDIIDSFRFRGAQYSNFAFQLSADHRITVLIDQQNPPAFSAFITRKETALQIQLDQNLHIVEKNAAQLDEARIIAAYCIAELYDRIPHYTAAIVGGYQSSASKEPHSPTPKTPPTEPKEPSENKPTPQPKPPRVSKTRNKYLVIDLPQQQEDTPPEEEPTAVDIQPTNTEQTENGVQLSLIIEHSPHWRETDIQLVQQARANALDRLRAESIEHQFSFTPIQEYVLMQGLMGDVSHRSTVRATLHRLLFPDHTRRIGTVFDQLTEEQCRWIVDRCTQLEQEEYAQLFHEKYRATEEQEHAWLSRQNDITTRRSEDEKVMRERKSTLLFVRNPERSTMTYVSSSFVRHPLLLRHGIG